MQTAKKMAAERYELTAALAGHRYPVVPAPNSRLGTLRVTHPETVWQLRGFTYRGVSAVTKGEPYDSR